MLGENSLLGALITWTYNSGWGYYLSGELGLVLLTVLVLSPRERIGSAPGIPGTGNVPAPNQLFSAVSRRFLIKSCAFLISTY